VDPIEPVELQIVERLSEPAPAQATLTLPFALRQKSRLRTRLDSGEDIGLFLPRGTILRHGDCLQTTTGQVIEVHAAPEAVSTACSDDSLLLTRAAYHLGNRHVALQVGAGWLRYRHDPLLDRMIADLGLSLRFEQAPFEPEIGTYSTDHPRHSQGHAS